MNDIVAADETGEPDDEQRIVNMTTQLDNTDDVPTVKPAVEPGYLLHERRVTTIKNTDVAALALQDQTLGQLHDNMLGTAGTQGCYDLQNSHFPVFSLTILLSL